MLINAPRIATLDDLKHSLQRAIELEHSTIPPYLCALYSLKPGTNQEIAELIRSVVTEEMQHMALVCNVLNAIGGSPSIDRPDFVPDYPGPLPMGIGSEGGEPFIVHLRPFSKELVHDTFMVIEEPEEPIPFKAAAALFAEQEQYRTIGQFYAAVQRKITELGEEIFTGDPARQVTEWYGEDDSLIRVTGVESALRAIEMIVSEGEGTSTSPLDEEHDLAHYYKFEEIYRGRRLREDSSAPHGWSFTGPEIPFDPQGVHAMIPDPRSGRLPEGSIARKLSDQFNLTYSNLLRALHITFNGAPGHLGAAMGLMFSLKIEAQNLTATPVPGTPYTAGPSFEYVAG